MSAEGQISKENMEIYFKELGKRYRKLSGKKTPAEIILIGGASVLLNYGFRDMTYDADAIICATSVMKEAINHVRDEFSLPHGWLNEDFKKTPSYSDRLIEVSVYYRSYSNILTVRTIAAEYLVAMKAMSGRQYKYDLSDIIGILWEHEKRNDPITRGSVDSAIIKLYDNVPIPDISRHMLDDVFKSGNYEMLYEEVREKERESKELILEFDKEHPNTLKGENISTIIEQIRQRKSDKP